MLIDYFNVWHFVGIILSIAAYIGLYYLLKNKNENIKKYVLFSLLLLGVALHFLKVFVPPYSNNIDRLYNDLWLINICAANIIIFPFIFISKSNKAKDYMVYLGLLSGLISIFVPIEPIEKGDNQINEILDIVRFYIHHSLLWIIPLLMVKLKLHKVSYKNSLWGPTGLLLLMLFIMLNQVFQYELGFIELRSSDFFAIKYKNTSYIWGPDDSISNFFARFTPSFFKVVPVGKYQGELKYWPWFWLIVPAYLFVTPLCFGVSLIFDYNNFKFDISRIYGNAKMLKKKTDRRT